MWVIKLNGGNFLKYNTGYLEGVSLSLADIGDAGSCASLDAGTGAGQVLLLSVADTLPALSGANLTSLGSIDTLSDVVLDAPVAGNFLVFDGEDWINTNLTSDAIIANVSPVNYTALNTDTLSTHLSAIDSVLATAGGLEFSRQSLNFNAVVGTHYSVNSSAGQVTATLPLLSSVDDGDTIRFYLRARAVGNNLVIQRSGGDLINGATSYTIDVQYDTITLVANTTDSLWEIV